MTKHVTTRTDRETLKLLRQLAEWNHCSMAAQLRMLVERAWRSQHGVNELLEKLKSTEDE